MREVVGGGLRDLYSLSSTWWNCVRNLFFSATERLLDRVSVASSSSSLRLGLRWVFPVVILLSLSWGLGVFLLRGASPSICASEGGFLLSILLGSGGATSSPVLGSDFCAS